MLKLVQLRCNGCGFSRVIGLKPTWHKHKLRSFSGVPQCSDSIRALRCCTYDAFSRFIVSIHPKFHARPRRLRVNSSLVLPPPRNWTHTHTQGTQHTPYGEAKTPAVHPEYGAGNRFRGRFLGPVTAAEESAGIWVEKCHIAASCTLDGSRGRGSQVAQVHHTKAMPNPAVADAMPPFAGV